MMASVTGTDDSDWLRPPLSAVRPAVARALLEDLAPVGDLTAALLPAGVRATGLIVTRVAGVLAGSDCLDETYAQLDGSVAVEWAGRDGRELSPGDVVATVRGPLPSLVTGERTALNFLCHLSGVATLARRYVEAVSSANPKTQVWDTRKTTPGLRALEKAAVRAGGGTNHRGSLSEGVLLKDNHLANTGIEAAVNLARIRWPGRLVEVECDTVEQLKVALGTGATTVMLDNMSPESVSECVALVRQAKAEILVEVSGGVTLDNAPLFAKAGADAVSVGAVTHSAPALDIGLDLET
jgi:nicotinate-nucleotide pyrophosphorylase (carboxylating)